MDSHLLEINLISVQGLRSPFRHRRVQAYAVSWVDPAFKLRTRVDRTGGENATWNDKFIFRVPATLLADDSPSAITIEIYAAAGWLRPDPLLDTVHLLSCRPDCPIFEVVGIRSPSGCFHGVLNVGTALLRCVSLVAAEVLAACPAIGYRDLLGQEGSKIRRWRAAAAAPGRVEDPIVEKDLALKECNGVKRSANGDAPARVEGPAAKKDSALKECNGEKRSSDGGEEEERLDAGVVRGSCLLGCRRRVHLSPSDQNLKRSGTDESPGW